MGEKKTLEKLPFCLRNWMVMNRIPFREWRKQFFRNNMLLTCLEVAEELEEILRRDKISVRMELKEVWADRDILCTMQVSSAVCALFYTMVCSQGRNRMVFSGKENCFICSAYSTDSPEKWEETPSWAVKECRTLAVSYLQSIGCEVDISQSDRLDQISVRFKEAGKGEERWQ